MNLKISFAVSIVLHISFFYTLLTLYQHHIEHLSHKIAIELIPTNPEALKKYAIRKARGPRIHSPKINLGLTYFRNGEIFSNKSYLQKSESDLIAQAKGLTNPSAGDLLFRESKVVLAFDLLAEKIDRLIDYPSLLKENGIQGTATLDLYFDHDGNIDEDRSKLLGSNRYVRGLLGRASRNALVQWYEHDAHHLKKNQFKDQHFHAEFIISYILPSMSEWEKRGPNSYSISRRHLMYECGSHMGFDLTCAASTLYGITKKLTSNQYRSNLQTLKDQLEYFDDIGLSGMRALIQGV